MLRSVIRPFVLGLIIGPPLAAWAVGGLFGLGAWGMLHNADAAWGLFWFAGFAVYLANVITWDALINKVIALQVVEQAEPEPPPTPQGFQRFELVTNSAGTVGDFFRWENHMQIIFVGGMIREGKNLLDYRSMSRLFTRDEWEGFREECKRHGYVEVRVNKRGAKSYYLNSKGKRDILTMANSPIPQYRYTLEAGT